MSGCEYCEDGEGADLIRDAKKWREWALLQLGEEDRGQDFNELSDKLEYLLRDA